MWKLLKANLWFLPLEDSRLPPPLSCLPQSHNAEQRPLNPDATRAIQDERNSLRIRKEYLEQELSDCNSGVQRDFWSSVSEPCWRIPLEIKYLNDTARIATQEKKIGDHYNQTWVKYAIRILTKGFSRKICDR